MSYATRPEITFSDRELVDLAIAWIVLSIAFALLLTREPGTGGIDVAAMPQMTALSFVTVGVAFLLHELAHKVVAIRFGQIAEFRADYNMLFLAIMSALIGFLFAAPGAVYHRGRITVKQNGLVALAGPLTNHALAVLFVPLMFAPNFAGAPELVGEIGRLGVWINVFLAAFNMIPYGPLDGNTVKEWSTGVFLAVFVPSLLAALYVIFFVGLR
ncbi:metalloprotease [Halovivax gelatinilyticus]|uniref:metalloprotease n=1 Tax=Halovivax gelatinilyticus TaxID=2961597 RepID=UPI0020CA46A8|nr:metalloprotease [Halovivax gelatinilyticus]